MPMPEYPAGRDLDVIIAEQLFGYSTISQSGPTGKQYICRTPSGAAFICPHYSTALADAWSIAEHFTLQPNVTRVEVRCEPNFADGSTAFPWYVLIERDGQYWGEAQAPSAALGICWAALRALGLPG